jgi:hypothetical protein
MSEEEEDLDKGVRREAKEKARSEVMTEDERKAAAEKRRKSFERSFAGPSVGKAGTSACDP